MEGVLFLQAKRYNKLGKFTYGGSRRPILEQRQQLVNWENVNGKSIFKSGRTPMNMLPYLNPHFCRSEGTFLSWLFLRSFIHTT